MKLIESFQNPTYKYLKSLSKSRNRKKEGVFLMEGRPELDHALKTGHTAKMIVFCEEYIPEADVLDWVAEETQLLAMKKALFDELSYQHVPGNFMAVYPEFTHSLQDLKATEKTILLEGLEKPGNLGAILRTCDALGVRQVLLVDSDIDLFNPNVVRNSRGALFGVMCVPLSSEEAWHFVESHNLNLVAAALTDQAVDYRGLKVERAVLTFGAESKGLSPFWLEKSGTHAIIPMNGIVDSLNLSVSVALMMQELFE